MTQIQFPNNQIIDFGDDSREEILSKIDGLQQSDPQLFKKSKDYGIAGIKTSRRSPVTRTGEVDDPEDIKPTHDGEIEDASFRFYFGRADNNSDRIARLNKAFGEGSFQQDKKGFFILDLDKVSSEQKKQLNLPESGSIYVNKPGFSKYDAIGFLGNEGLPLLASIGAGLAATGVGTAAGIGLISAAAAAGKAADEFIFEDLYEGLQTQSTRDVLSDVVLEGALALGGEVVGRGIGTGIKRLVKGKGAVPDEQIRKRIEQQFLKNGYEPKEARKLSFEAAREEQAVNMRKMIDEGASIPIQTLSGKAILGRTQAIYEQIFPNDELAAQNAKFVSEQLEKVRKGLISQEEAGASVAARLQPFIERLQQRMIDEKTAFGDAQKAIDGILKIQFKGLEDAFKIDPNLNAQEFIKTLDPAINLFNIHSKNLYEIAKKDLGEDNATLSLANLNKILDDAGFAARDAEGKLIKPQTVVDGLLQREAIAQAGLDEIVDLPIFNLIRNSDRVSITDLPALKAAIRASRADPRIKGQPADQLVGNLIKSLDDTMSTKILALIEDPINATNKQLKKGIENLKKANKFYGEGMDIINTGLNNSLKNKIDNGFIADMSEIVNTVVKANQPELLSSFIRSITPSAKVTNDLINIRASSTPTILEDIATELERGNIAEALKSLNKTGVIKDEINKVATDKGIVQISDDVAKLPVDDPTRISTVEEYVKLLRQYDDLSKRNINPEQFTNKFRDTLARTWINSNIRTETGSASFRQLASKFDQLGVATQKELFGDRYNEVKTLMDGFRLGGLKGDRLAEEAAKLSGRRALSKEFLGVTDDSTKELDSVLEQLVKDKQRIDLQGEENFFKAVGGEDFDADKLVDHLIKNPKSIERLKIELGPEGEGIERVRDAVAARLLPTDILSDLGGKIQSGDFQKEILKNLNNANQNGLVTEILGKDFVDDITKIGNDGEIISDAVLKGKTGLASAAYAAGFAGAFLLNPIAALGGAATILGVSKALRSKAVMRFFTSPRLRAYAAQRARDEGGARLGDRNLAAEKAIEAANTAIRQIVLQLGGAAVGSGAERVERAVTPLVEEAREQIQPEIERAREQVQDLNLPDTSNFTPLANQQPRPVAPGMGTGEQLLADIERRKALGLI